MLNQSKAPIVMLFILPWSDEHEKTEEKTEREVESLRIDRLDGSEFARRTSEYVVRLGGNSLSRFDEK